MWLALRPRSWQSQQPKAPSTVVAHVKLHDQDLQFVAQVKLQAPSLLIDRPLLNRQLGNKYNSRLQQLFVDLLGMTW
jgi:hypothetical protein